MSILSDTAILAEMTAGRLTVSHFDEAALQPASIDLRLGADWAFPRPPLGAIRPYSLTDSESYWQRASLDRHVLNPGEFALATTAEEVKLDRSLAARVEGKSTLGRWGLLVHTTAGFIDPGFEGPITLELRNVGPFRLRLDFSMYICQIAFERVEGEVRKPYSGHYQRQKGIGLPY